NKRQVSSEGKTLAAKRNKYLAANKWLNLLNIPLPEYNAELEGELTNCLMPVSVIDYEPDALPILELVQDEEPEAEPEVETEEYPWGMTQDAYLKYEAKVAELMVELKVEPHKLDAVADYLENNLDEKQALNKASIRKAITEYLTV
ncbi:hypothetical protein, partial [Vibrio parahaemolyticus]